MYIYIYTFICIYVYMYVYTYQEEQKFKCIWSSHITENNVNTSEWVLLIQSYMSES